MNDVKYKELLLSDNIGEPSPKVFENLQYQYMLKSNNYRIRQNSFSGMFEWLFSSKQIVSKLTIAACFAYILTISPIIKKNLNSSNPIDSTKTNHVSIIDTSYIDNHPKEINDNLN